jgi:hypothetical protein
MQPRAKRFLVENLTGNGLAVENPSSLWFVLTRQGS